MSSTEIYPKGPQGLLLVRSAGIEPARLGAAVFETTMSTIPPRPHTCFLENAVRKGFPESVFGALSGD